eukprot:gene3425-3750_t
MLVLVTDSVPKSKAEVVFTRFQDTAIASATAGRSLLNLCSLLDLRLTGRISKDGLIRIAKMMDCHLTSYDLEAMSELLPGSCGIESMQMLSGSWAAGPGQAVGGLSTSMRASNATWWGALPAYAYPGVA